MENAKGGTVKATRQMISPTKEGAKGVGFVCSLTFCETKNGEEIPVGYGGAVVWDPEGNMKRATEMAAERESVLYAFGTQAHHLISKGGDGTDATDRSEREEH